MQNYGIGQKLHFVASRVFFLIFISLVLAVVYIYITDIKINRDNFYKLIDDPILIENNVKLEASDGSTIVCDLPTKLDSSKDYTLKFIPQATEDGEQIFVNIRSSYLSFTLTCGDQVIASYLADENASVKSMASAVKFFEIPENLLGKEFTLHLKSNIKNKHGMKISPIMYGSKTSILKVIYIDNLPETLFFLFLYIIAFVPLTVYIISYFMKNPSRKWLIIAVFIFNIAITSLFSSWLTYYYIDKYVVNYYIESSFVNINFIPFILLFINYFNLKEYLNWRYQVLKIICIVFSVNAVLQVVLTLLSVSEFIILRPVTQLIHILAFFVFVGVILTMDKQIIKEKNGIILSILPLSISSVLISYEYFINDVASYKPIFILSMVLFLIIQLLMEIKINFIKYVSNIESTFYRELAYIDSLSKLFNRHAFDKDMASLKNRETFYQNMLFIMVDINGLKRINDQIGHRAGDMCIQICGDILMDIQNAFSKTYAYRYAGDEFFVVSYDKNYKQVRKILKKIDENVSNYSKQSLDFNVSIALGYSYVELGYNFSLGAIMKEVDQKMYNDKKIKKEASYV